MSRVKDGLCKLRRGRINFQLSGLGDCILLLPLTKIEKSGGIE